MTTTIEQRLSEIEAGNVGMDDNEGEFYRVILDPEKAALCKAVRWFWKYANQRRGKALTAEEMESRVLKILNAK